MMSDEELLQYKPRMGLMNVAEKIHEAEILKQQGNLLFKKSKFRKAITSYVKVFAYVNGISSKGDAMCSYSQQVPNALNADDDEASQIKQLQLTAWSNIAMCHLKLGNAEKAMESCDKVLGMDPDHTKAMFRKAQALMLLKYFDRAKDLLLQLHTKEPGNASVRSELHKLASQRKQYEQDAKAKSGFANIFNKNAGTGLYGKP